jgi:hypothetical protein
MSNRLLDAGSKTKIIWGWILVLILPLDIIAYLILSTTNVFVTLVGIIGIFVLPVGVVLLVVGYMQKGKS